VVLSFASVATEENSRSLHFATLRSDDNSVSEETK
jgi:hypothetical protein